MTTKLFTNPFVFITSAFLFLFVLSTSCDKKLGSYNSDFIGTWRTDTLEGSTAARNELIIEKNDGAYHYYCTDDCGDHLCECNTEQTGKPVINSDRTQIRIGSANSTKLTIDKEPYQDADGQWIMEIGSLTYYKQ